MKKIILSVGCIAALYLSYRVIAGEPENDGSNYVVKEIEVDGCQYLILQTPFSAALCHKANCNNHHEAALVQAGK